MILQRFGKCSRTVGNGKVATRYTSDIGRRGYLANFPVSAHCWMRKT